MKRTQEFDIDASRNAAYSIADEYDPALFFTDELLDRLNYEPQAAFDFVRDQIGFDPYRGSLRDAQGVLGAQAGNALDRSMLLVHLLRDMGYEARLVFGRLPSAQQERLLERTLKPTVGVDIEPLASLGGFVPAMKDRLKDRAFRDFRWLSSIVDPAELPGRPEKASPENLQTHVWVQARLNGDWMDMDTSFGDARIDDAFAEPDRYSLELSDSERQRVRLKVVAEYAEAGPLVETVVLSADLVASQVARSQIYLTFQPVNASLGNTLAQKLGGKDGYRPVLLIDGEPQIGEVIPEISQKLDENEAFLFDSQRARELTGLYLDVETLIPGEQGTSRRRPFLDRLPAAKRVSGNVELDDIQPAARAEGVPLVYRNIHQIVVSNGGSNPHQVANNVGLAVYFMGRYMSDEETVAQMTFDAMMWPMAMLRNVMVAVNERITPQSLNDRDDLRFYIGEPRVFVFSLSAGEENWNGSIGWSIDLLLDRVRAVALDDVDPAEVAIRQMWYGVLQGAFETTYLETMILATGAGGETLNASELSLAQPLVLASLDDVQQLVSPPYALHRALSRGERVVVSTAARKEPAFVWWTVADDGETRAMLAPGLGGSNWDHRWGRHTNINPYAKVKPTDTQARPEMSSREMKRQQQKAMIEALKKAQQKADKEYTGKGEHAARTNKAGRTPKVKQQSGGHTEYSLVETTSIWMTLTGAQFFALVMTATLVAAFITIYAFISIYNLARQRSQGD